MVLNTLPKWVRLPNPARSAISETVNLESCSRERASLRRVLFTYSLKVKPVVSLNVRLKWEVLMENLSDMYSRDRGSAKLPLMKWMIWEIFLWVRFVSTKCSF